jgi:soluble lytic murein transglycosylase
MQSFAGQWQLDEAWVYGLIRQESRFVQDARSSAGAAGLMQLMPKTARWVARRLGLKNYKRSLIDELETNIQLGTYYLRYVYDKLGHPVLATAAYNAGPVRARQWQDPQPMEGAVYTESIPLNETRDYVQKVMNNVVHYAAQFRQKPVPLKNRMGTIDGKPDDADEEERG